MTHSITLRSGLTARFGSLCYLREAIKLRVRALLHLRQTQHWLGLLNSNPALGDLARSCPHLVRKIYRPYLSRTLNCQARLAVLTTHYELIMRYDLGPLVLRAARTPVVLAGVNGKSGAVYQIQLLTIGALEREGELVLQLTCGEALVYSIAFSFFNAEHGLTMGVGCIQGPQGSDGLARISAATRELHGLRPKNLMVRLARQIGHDFGCNNMILVGNVNRAAHRSVRKGLVFADYDALWRELGAHACDDGNFQLACEDLTPPVMAEIASNKRSQARKRHELLESVIGSIRLHLNRV